MTIQLPKSMRDPFDKDREAELTPREIVVELDKYIIGQDAAKRAVAIALRNRCRAAAAPARAGATRSRPRTS